jgi:pSer/pThr/pTyr-binding forkhead associated (FHA) protein
MSLKTWIVGKMNRVLTRTDLPPRHAAHFGSVAWGSGREPVLRSAAGRNGAIAPGLDHLGQYGPLVKAIREELEDFVASHLRRHLAIAERDRYLLTSIRVESTGAGEARKLLERFRREFTPEQVKHYLAREIVARLPNASAIDLSQFAGLDTSSDQSGSDGDDGFEELMNELRSAEPVAARRAYEVTLVGRWSAGDPRATATATGARRFDTPPTPLAGAELVLDVEDAGGGRRIAITALPGHRYIVGKEQGSDIEVDGVYASRRHCEIWLEHGVWWATDAGSTNGIRVEPAGDAALESGRARVSTPSDRAVLEVPPGACIVLTASARGDARQYPRLVLRPPANAPLRPSGEASSHTTPVTPIAVPRGAATLMLTARTASGVRTVELAEGAAPFRVGRSRSQALVVDWAHESVSGHHVDIVEPDPSGAHVVVHGDNGVCVDGTRHPPGARFRWKLGETMILGRASEGEPECSLTLARP